MIPALKESTFAMTVWNSSFLPDVFGDQGIDGKFGECDKDFSYKDAPQTDPRIAQNQIHSQVCSRIHCQTNNQEILFPEPCQVKICRLDGHSKPAGQI